MTDKVKVYYNDELLDTDEFFNVSEEENKIMCKKSVWVSKIIFNYSWGNYTQVFDPPIFFVPKGNETFEIGVKS